VNSVLQDQYFSKAGADVITSMHVRMSRHPSSYTTGNYIYA